MKRYTLVEVINNAVIAAQANLHTSTVAVVTKVNDTTINCQPVINRVVKGESIKLPEFIEVPPVFAQGGDSYRTYPIAVGDYCLLHFMERCFDAWYNGQNFVPPVEFRMHDYSDGFAVVGVNPRLTALIIGSVIKDQGDIAHIGNMTRTGTLTQTGNVNITGDYTQIGNMTVTGNITCTGTITAANFVTTGGVDLTAHVHSGVEAGSSNTGAPVT